MNDTRVVQRLIAFKYDLHARDGRGYTTLNVIAASHSVHPHAYNMAKLLLDNGAVDQEIMSKMGKIIIMVVSLNNPER